MVRNLEKKNRTMQTDIEYPTRVEVNTNDLELAIREGCNPMQQMIDPNHDNLPYFSNCMSGPDPRNDHHASYSMAHVPGRWLNALLSAESVLDLKLNERVVDDLARWTHTAFSHEMGLPQGLNLKNFKTTPVTDLHNLRETTHALYALASYRDDKEALKIVKRQIETVNRFYDFETGVWNEKAFNQEFDSRTNAGAPFPRHFGRYIGPLVKLYAACGIEEALVQAIRLKDLAFRNILNEKGDYDVKVLGPHTHSITSMISSLAQLAEVLGDNTIFELIIAFMENGLRQIALEFGWCIENYNHADHIGEINNTGDILETCLILGKAGYTKYFQQAERILRAHLLPSQLLDTCFIPEWDCPNEDYHHKLATRAKGAFGFPCPYGHQYKNSPISFNWDITGGAIGSLCEAFRTRVTKSDSLISVNLHFNYKDNDVEIKSPYTNGGVMEIRLKRKYLIRVRLSDWLDRDKLYITVNVKKLKPILSGNWVYLPGLQADSLVKIKIPMKITATDYRFRSDIFRFRWKGDAVDAAANLASNLCFFKGI